MSFLDDAVTGSLKNITDKLNALLPDSNVLRPPDFLDGFVVYEIVNGVVRPNSKLQLVGPFAPYQPFEFSGKQRIVKTYYPGNDQPTLQVMGNSEDNVKITGCFRAKKLKVDLAPAVQEIQADFDALRRRGNLMKFELGDWVRYGMIESVKFRIKTMREIEYEMDLLIQSHTMPTDDFFAGSSASVPAISNAALKDAMAQLTTLASNYTASMPSSIGNLINNLVSGIAKAVGLVTTFVDAIVSEAQDIEKSIDRAIGLIENARSTIAQYKRTLGQQALYVGSVPMRTNSAVQSTIAQVKNAGHILELLHATARPIFIAPPLVNGSYQASSSVQNSNSIESLLAQMQAQFKAIKLSIPRVRHVVKSGETLQKIAVMYYQSAEKWTTIYDHNQLQTSVLTEGTILEIPA